MKTFKIAAKTKNPERQLTVELPQPETLNEAIDVWGEKVVFNRAVAAVTIDIQAKMRGFMVDKLDKEGKVTASAKTDEEIQEALSNWKPGEKTIQRKTPIEKLKQIMAKMSPEDRAALLATAADALDDDEEEEAAA